MAGMFDDILNSEPGMFDDILAEPAPQPRKMSEADPATLPKTWDVEIGGQRLRGTFDPKAGKNGAYVVPAADGGKLYIAKGDDGSLGLKRLRGRPVGRLAQFGIGVAQGVSDVANAGARAVEGGARLIDRGFQAVGVNPYGVLDAIPERLGLASGAEQAIANQERGYQELTGDSGTAMVGRIGGQVAATLPVSQVRVADALAAGTSRVSPAIAQNIAQGWTGRAIDGAAQAAIGAGLVSSANPDVPVAEQMGMGATIGGVAATVLPPVVRAAGQGFSAITNRLASRMAPAEAEKVAATVELSLKQAGFDPGNMSREVQKRLADYIESGADDLSPEALRRVANAESLPFPVKLSRGSITRDFKQQQAESILSRTPQGQQLREAELANNAAIGKNMEKLAADQRPTATGPYFIGQSVRKAAQGAEDASWRQVGESYNKARATGRQLMIDPAPIVDQINKNIDAINAGNDSGPIMQMVSALQRFGVIKQGADGLFEPTGNQMMGDQLMQLYQSANQSFKPGTTSAIHIGDVKRGILAALDSVDDAGPEYRAAIGSMKRHVREFDDPRAVSQILKMSSDTDPMVAAERIFDKAFVKASIDDVQNLNKMMLRSDKSVRRDATAAVRNMRAGLVKFLLDESYIGQSTNELGERVISGSNMLRAVEKLGGGDLATGWQKIDALMGPKHTAQLKKVVGTAYDATSKVPAAAQTSNTAERILSAIGGLPIMGGATEIAIRGTIDVIKSQVQKKAAAGAADGSKMLAEAAAAKAGARAAAEKAAIGRRVSAPSALSLPALNQPAAE